MASDTQVHPSLVVETRFTFFRVKLNKKSYKPFNPTIIGLFLDAIASLDWGYESKSESFVSK